MEHSPGEQFVNDATAAETEPTDDFVVARFEIDLGLDAGEPQDLKEAAAAVRQESLDGSRWKRLKCLRVSICAERDRGTVYLIHVDSKIQFDWNWEGAIAFCPMTLSDLQPAANSLERILQTSDVLWSGEILAVDQQEGCLFVAIDDPESIPQQGDFYVRPFEFLSVQDSIYNADAFTEIRKLLPGRLKACEGGVHPVFVETENAGLLELQNWWQHTWSLLWGPPGTGKTWTTGQQIARVIAEPDERILVISTTNDATDTIARSIGNAAKEHCIDELEDDLLQRIGKGASYQSFVADGLESMLQGTESQTLSRIDQLAQQLTKMESIEEKALAKKQIGALKSNSNDQSKMIFLDAEKRVVITTAFKAMSYLGSEVVRKMIEDGHAPFTTVFIDEAGLISRTAVAALSLMAANRVVLVGDSKQLSPISRISRILPSRQQRWLASSALGHLSETEDLSSAIHLLSEQRRMHPDVCEVVSQFQYNGVLTTANDRVKQESSLTEFLHDFSRAIWYVLDEEDVPLWSIRPSRGDDSNSWVREITPRILYKLFHDQDLRSARGCFVTPFKGQVLKINRWLAENRINNWKAASVHSLQGSETDVVIFDSVNASSTGWQYDEWKRLINVAISRAREAVIVLASRSEMNAPFLRPLKSLLKPGYLQKQGRSIVWKQADADKSEDPAVVAEEKSNWNDKFADSNGKVHSRMGGQVAQRKNLSPILSQEQQKLTNLELDGRPRLVRGVAGSGKSVVLCNWLAKTAKRMIDKDEATIWAVYANRSLHNLLEESIESAWRNLRQDDMFVGEDFPWHKVSLLHVRDVLAGLLPAAGISADSIGFDYDRAAETFLKLQAGQELQPRCSALFIDEAQDMGPSVLRLLLSLIEKSDQHDANSRSAHIFYDNAQNVYDTKTPKWSDFGLDMRGRSTIMKESFRSTAPITEFAVNVLDRLSAEGVRLDQQELISLGLLKKTERNNSRWLQVCYNQIHGPKPLVQTFQSREDELDAIFKNLKYLIQHDGISPSDITIIYTGEVSKRLRQTLSPQLTQLGVELSFQKNQAFQRRPNTLVATTPHSFKGYESEVVIIPSVDQYVAAGGKILDNSLYVAMTRARSLLAIYGTKSKLAASQTICDVLCDCDALQNFRPEIEVLEP